MLASKKVMKQKQEIGARVAQIKALRKIDSGLPDQYKHDNYNTNKSQNSQSNGETDLDKIEDLNIS